MKQQFRNGLRWIARQTIEFYTGWDIWKVILGNAAFLVIGFWAIARFDLSPYTAFAFAYLLGPTVYSTLEK
jgi:hypothetical protein